MSSVGPNMFRCQPVGRRPPLQSPRANPLVDPEVRSSNAPGGFASTLFGRLLTSFFQQISPRFTALQLSSLVSSLRSRSCPSLLFLGSRHTACRAVTSFRAFSPPFSICLRAAFSRADKDRFSRVRADEPCCGLPTQPTPRSDARWHSPPATAHSH